MERCARRLRDPDAPAASRRGARSRGGTSTRAYLASGAGRSRRIARSRRLRKRAQRSPRAEAEVRARGSGGACPGGSHAAGDGSSTRQSAWHLSSGVARSITRQLKEFLVTALAEWIGRGRLGRGEPLYRARNTERPLDRRRDTCGYGERLDSRHGIGAQAELVTGRRSAGIVHTRCRPLPLHRRRASASLLTTRRHHRQRQRRHMPAASNPAPRSLRHAPPRSTARSGSRDRSPASPDAHPRSAGCSREWPPGDRRRLSTTSVVTLPAPAA